MANTINTVKDGPGIFAKGVAESLRDNLQLCKFVSKEDKSDFNGKNGFNAGDTIFTSIPDRPTVQEDNLDITSLNSDLVEEKAALVLNKSVSVKKSFDSLELATDIDISNALQRYGIPAAESMAQQIESRCFGIVADATYNSAGTGLFTVAETLAGRTKLNQSLAPMKDRMLFVNSVAGSAAVTARSGLFQSSDKIKEQYEEGYMGRSDGYDWVESELMRTHANSSDVVGIAVNDASVSEGASTLTIDGASAAVTVGSVFTIAGVNKVHPITKVDLGVLQQFTATTSSTTSIGITPSLYAASGGLQNVTALPADNAALVFVGAASAAITQNIGMHKSAFKMVTVPLYAPKGVDMVASETVDGITVNIVRDFDVNTRKVITRFDVLYAFDAVRPEWAVRMPGA